MEHQKLLNTQFALAAPDLSQNQSVSPKSIMNKLRYLAFSICVLATLGAVRATTVIPPTFDELVGRAELIFQGSVTNVRSQWVGEGAQRHIASYITFNVEDALKGTPGTSYTIQMLGGTVGDETMEVSDGPKFTVGDRDILFVEHNGQQFVPLVGIMHGRFRIQREAQTGREMVVTNKGDRLTDPDQLGKAANLSNHPTTALSPIDFKGAIRARLQQPKAGGQIK